jgi:hypothetical protein
MTASGRGHLELVNIFLENDADVNARSVVWPMLRRCHYMCGTSSDTDGGCRMVGAHCTLLRSSRNTT